MVFESDVIVALTTEEAGWLAAVLDVLDHEAGYKISQFAKDLVDELLEIDGVVGEFDRVNPESSGTVVLKVRRD